MNFELQLRAATDLFENKIKQARKEYRKRNSEEIIKEKMDAHINRKMKNDINFLLAANICGPLKSLS